MTKPSNSLPSRPNLDHLRSQANALLGELRAGQTDAARTFIAYLPAANAMKPAEVRAAGFRLCIGLTGSPRPTGFVTAAGSGHALQRLHRVSTVRPAGVTGGTRAPRNETETVASTTNDDSALAQPMTALLRELQGEWLPVSLVNNGKPLPAAYLAYGTRIQIGNETKVVFGGQTMVHALIRIDETVSPASIDYLNVGQRPANGFVRHSRLGRVGFSRLHGEAGRPTARRLLVRVREWAHAERVEAEGMTVTSKSRPRRISTFRSPMRTTSRPSFRASRSRRFPRSGAIPPVRPATRRI